MKKHKEKEKKGDLSLGFYKQKTKESSRWARCIKFLVAVGWVSYVSNRALLDVFRQQLSPTNKKYTQRIEPNAIRADHQISYLNFIHLHPLPQIQHISFKFFVSLLAQTCMPLSFYFSHCSSFLFSILGSVGK